MNLRRKHVGDTFMPSAKWNESSTEIQQVVQFCIVCDRISQNITDPINYKLGIYQMCDCETTNLLTNIVRLSTLCAQYLIDAIDTFWSWNDRIVLCGTHHWCCACHQFRKSLLRQLSSSFVWIVFSILSTPRHDAIKIFKFITLNWPLSFSNLITVQIATTLSHIHFIYKFFAYFSFFFFLLSSLKITVNILKFVPDMHDKK